jgi:hypothetical protein
MRKRADTRFWISIFASAIVFPLAAIATFTVWFIRLELPPPAEATPNPVMLAVHHPNSPVRAPAEAAVMPPPKAIAEPAAPPPTARTPEPLSTMPVLGTARPVYADPKLDTSTIESPGMPVEPAAGSLSPQPNQQTAGVAEAAAPQSDAKVPERVSVPPMIATPAVAPPMARDTHPMNGDPVRDALAPTSPVVPTELAALEPSRLIEGPIPLPKLRPHITLAFGSRTLPLPRPRPVENSSSWTYQQ